MAVHSTVADIEEGLATADNERLRGDGWIFEWLGTPSNCIKITVDYS